MSYIIYYKVAVRHILKILKFFTKISVKPFMTENNCQIICDLWFVSSHGPCGFQL